MTLAICTYNNAAGLDRALAGIEQQLSCPAPWSLLVVDNNCTDDTAAVVDRYQRRGRIPGLRRMVERRQGVAFARRRAIVDTDSPWVAFVDDDCLLAPNWLAEAVVFCEAHPRAGAINGRIDILWEVPPDKVIAGYASGYGLQDYGPQPCQVPLDGGLGTAGLVLRRQAVVASGWLEHRTLVGRNGRKLTTGEDTELVFRIRNAGYELWYNPAMVVQHCVPRRRMSVEYLCRLYRGCGQSRPITKSMKINRRPTLGWRMRVFWDRVRLFSRLGRSLLLDHVLCGRPVTPEQRIGLAFRWGELEGAVQFLLKGYRP